MRSSKRRAALEASGRPSALQGRSGLAVPARASAGHSWRSPGTMTYRSRPVTVTAGQVTTGRAVPAPLPTGASAPPDPPRLADGVELLGEYRDSGYSQPPSLVRRPDGQVIQMSALLYGVACRIDGSRDFAAIAELVSADVGRSLTADQ